MDERVPQTTAVAEAPKVLEVPGTMKALIETLIFAAEEPLSVKQLKAIYEYSAPPGSGVERKLDADTIRSIVQELNTEYRSADRPYRIVPIAGGFQFSTLKEYADWLGKLRREQGRRKLSQSSIETLAIVAYKQPITKGEIEAIRGVNCDYVLKTLLEKELITVTGRAESVGRPLLYGSTREFLQHFALNEITDLPRPREIEEILGETQFETERRMLEAQAGADKAKEDEDFKSRLPHIPKKKPGLAASPVEIVPRTSKRELRTRITPELSFDGAEQAPDAGFAEPVPQQDATQGNTGGSQDSAVQAVSPPIPEEVAPLAAAPHEDQGPTPEASPSDHPTSPNRWQSWKEKIQGFIKRLFD
ncbi:MAG: SMC-Scp complex subunit ScpB [Bacteroidota bacterium]